MKLKSTFLLFVFSFSVIFSYSQNHECGSHHGYLNEQKSKFPQFYKSLENKNQELEDQNAKLLSKIVPNQKSSSKKIIPVVVHVIHDFGSENVTDAQVNDAIRVLNENINGQDPQFVSRTPDVFAAVVGKPNLEFRLATKDPNGNPTSGINRVQSEMTQVPNPRDQVKALSYWNSYQYLNIWVVKSLPTENGGVLLGYAQFPFGGSMSTDGVAIIANQFASTSSSTLTHEVGHWLGLRHVWGDAVCGDDQVADTPPQRYSNGFGDNPGPLPTTNSFPYHVGLQNQGCIADSLNWAGEMFMNYMDYTDDQYCTMFSEGQVDVFNITLDGEDGGLGYREYMWQEENLIATGTNEGAVPPSCNKQADFQEGFGNSSVCLGEEVWFKSNKSMFGSSITSVLWDLGDGNTSSVENNYLHDYSQSGVYDVSLTINYNEETQVSSDNLSSLDLANASSYDSTTAPIIVQGTQSELNDMNASNITSHPIDSLGVYFGLDGTTFYRGYVNKKIYTAYYNNNCSSTKVKQAFIAVNPNTASNNASSYSYGFENADDIVNDWRVVSANEDPSQWSFNSSAMTSWQWFEGNNNTSSCVMMSSKDGSSISVDDLISPSYNLSSYTTPAIKFKYTGAAVNTFPTNEVSVYYTTNCGDNWAFLGKLSNLHVARAGLYTTNYAPDGDWQDTVMTKSALKNDNVQFKFEYSNSGASNNFYLDDIEIGEEADLLKQNIEPLSRVNIFPNPSVGDVNILISNIKNKNISVTLLDILGQEVKNLYQGEVIQDNLQIETNLNSLDKGVYFINVSEGNTVLNIDKFILNK
tara:strand:- start:2462 stop:4885 length:2424 start_codon:yes stop_codon:yes gene_type:complete